MPDIQVLKEQLDSARSRERFNATKTASSAPAAAGGTPRPARPLNLAGMPTPRGEGGEEGMKTQLESGRLGARMAAERGSQPAAPQTAAQALPGGSLAALAGLAGGGSAALTQPLSKEILRQSWLNLIDSVGLTFLYLIFHFIVRYVAGSNILCRFGEEGAFGLIPSSAQSAISAGGEENIINKGTELAEIIVFFIILITIAVSAFIQFIITMLPVLIVAGIITFGITSIF